jgi:hypothetical protein
MSKPLESRHAPTAATNKADPTNITTVFLRLEIVTMTQLYDDGGDVSRGLTTCEYIR